MDNPRIPPAGDPFTAARKADQRRLAELEHKLQHELLDASKRCELADEVARLRRRLHQGDAR